MSDSVLDPVSTAITKMLDLRSRQHELVTTNIANADTPGFKARHIDFDATLERMLRDAPQPTATHEGHLGAGGTREAVVELADPAGWSLDGNSVDPQREMAVLTENQLLYTAGIEILSRRMAVLRYAIGEGK